MYIFHNEYFSYDFPILISNYESGNAKNSAITSHKMK